MLVILIIIHVHLHVAINYKESINSFVDIKVQHRKSLPDVTLGHGVPCHPQVPRVGGGVTKLDKVSPHGGDGQRHPRVLGAQRVVCPLVVKLVTVTDHPVNVGYVWGPGTEAGITLRQNECIHIF